MPERDMIDRMVNAESEAEFDELLRMALASYGEPAPGADVARKVLDRVEHETTPVSMRRLLPWAIALPIAAGLILLAVLIGMRPERTSAGHHEQARVVQPANGEASATGAATARPAIPQSARARRVGTPRAATAATVQAMPKREVFPTPQPFTPQERALVTYAAHAPEQERRSLIETQKEMDAPLSIAAIHIEPLEPPENSGN